MDKSKIDEAVLKLLTKVREKKEAIKAAKKRPQWQTSCTLSLGPDTAQSRINIQTVRDIGKLVEICAFLQRQDFHMRGAAKCLGLEYDSKYMGYTVEDWITDLKTRVGMLKLEQQKKDLDALNKRVDKLVTPEQRREMELIELQKILD